MDQPDNWEDIEEDEEEDEEEKKLMRKHPEIDWGREEDRARVWFLPRVRVLELGARFEKIIDDETNVWAEIFNDPNSERSLLAPLTRLLHELYPTGADDYPRRGDLVYIEHELEPFNDQGKYFYDGSNIIIAEDQDDEIAVPRVFEVITEFPIQYWKDRLINYYLIHFNFTRYFPSISLNEIKLDNKVPFYQFYVEEQAFRIYANKFAWTRNPEGTFFIPTREEFLTALRTSAFFSNQDGRLRLGKKFQGITFKNIDPETTLFLTLDD